MPAKLVVTVTKPAAFDQRPPEHQLAEAGVVGVVLVVVPLPVDLLVDAELRGVVLLDGLGVFLREVEGIAGVAKQQRERFLPGRVETLESLVVIQLRGVESIEHGAAIVKALEGDIEPHVILECAISIRLKRSG